MIKEINSSEIKKFLQENPNVELLDVRTPQEWETVGQPDGEKIDLQTHFITIERGADGNVDNEFVNKIKKTINKDKKLLVMCKSGARSMLASEILTKESYDCTNISDGYEGNGVSSGWIGEGLPYFFKDS